MPQTQENLPSTARRPLVRLAFVGTGNWARRYHLPSLNHIRQHKLGGCELVLHGIYGVRQNEAEELAGQYHFGRVYPTLDDLMGDAEVDAVAIVISPEATKQVVLQVMEKELPLITEKPPGANYAEAQELAERVQVPHVVGFNRRYGVLNNRFREMVQRVSGIVSVRGVMHRVNRQQPHFVLHAGPHLINFMEYLFGPIRSLRTEHRIVPSTGGRLYLGHACFESGLTGEIELTPAGERHWEGIEVHTTEQTLILHSPHNDGAGEILRRREGAADEVLDRSGENVPVVEEGYAWEHVDLLNAVGGPRPVRSTFQNAVNTMRVAEALETGRDLVDGLLA